VKALKTTVAIVLFTPGSFVVLFALWQLSPMLIIGSAVIVLAWLGVALLRGEPRMEMGPNPCHVCARTHKPVGSSCSQADGSGE
jgi:hypothetical protein